MTTWTAQYYTKPSLLDERTIRFYKIFKNGDPLFIIRFHDWLGDPVVHTHDGDPARKFEGKIRPHGMISTIMGIDISKEDNLKALPQHYIRP